MAELAATAEPRSTAAICRALDATPQDLGDAFDRLLASKQVVGYAGVWMESKQSEAFAQAFVASLRGAHERAPDRPAIPVAHLRKAGLLTLTGKPGDRFLQALADRGDIVFDGDSVRWTGFKPTPTAKSNAFLNRIAVALEAEGSDSPSLKALATRLRLPVEAVRGGLELGRAEGRFMELEEGVWFTRAMVQEFRDRLRAEYQGRWFTANDVRDRLGSSRRTVRPLLDHLDELGWTERRDGMRRLRHPK